VATFINTGSKWFRHFANDAMSARDPDRFCKHESGAAKAKKRKLREEFDKTQKGVLDKYFPKEAVKQEDSSCLTACYGPVATAPDPALERAPQSWLALGPAFS